MFRKFGLMNGCRIKRIGRLITVNYHLSNDWMERLRGRGTYHLPEEYIAKFG